MNMTSRAAGLACALALLATATAHAEQTAAAGTPLAVVRHTVDGVIAVLADKGRSEDSRRREVKALISENFDFAAMANRVLATNWRKASKSERSRFTNLFRELLSNTYWARISAYRDEQVEYLGERQRSERLATVNTLIKTDSADIPVDYKLYLRGERWLAYDVVIEQVSLVRNYRSSFQDLVRQKGIAGLISELETKVAASSAPAP